MASRSGVTAAIVPATRKGRSNARGATAVPMATATMPCDRDEGIYRQNRWISESTSVTITDMTIIDVIGA
jgi:hypothetical protein